MHQMGRRGVPYNPDELSVPCAFVKLPWTSETRIAPLVPPKIELASNYRPAIFFKDYINRMAVEEVCFEPPLYVIRFCYNRNEDTETFCQIFTSEQIMAVQHILAQHEEINFFGSCRCMEIRCNPENEMLKSHKILIIHHILEPIQFLPIDYELLEELWTTRIIDKLMQFIATEEFFTHLAIFIDASQTMTVWKPEYMAYLIHLTAQIVSVISATLPLKLNGIDGFKTFQIVIVPCTAFSDGVKALRHESNLRILKSEIPQRNRWWFCKTNEDHMETPKPIEFSPDQYQSFSIEYVGFKRNKETNNMNSQPYNHLSKINQEPKVNSLYTNHRKNIDLINTELEKMNNQTDYTAHESYKPTYTFFEKTFPNSHAFSNEFAQSRINTFTENQRASKKNFNLNSPTQNYSNYNHIDSSKEKYLSEKKNNVHSYPDTTPIRQFNNSNHLMYENDHTNLNDPYLRKIKTHPGLNHNNPSRNLIDLSYESMKMPPLRQNKMTSDFNDQRSVVYVSPIKYMQ